MLCTELAKQIAADGEGASKFLTINVKGAKSFADAKTVGMAIANSPLVKTAFFGEDPNWGRVICAVGYSGADMVPEKTVVKFGGITILLMVLVQLMMKSSRSCYERKRYRYRY